MSINRAQREKINHFSAVTGAPPKIAQEFLKRNSWSLEHSVDSFFHSGQAQHHLAPAVDTKKVEALWQRYAANGRINADGVGKLCEDLEVDPCDPVTLVLAYYCSAEEMGSFSHEEFCRGVMRLECDTVEKLRNKLPEMRQQLQDRASMKEIYAFTFSLSLESGQKNLPVDLVIELWRLLLKEHFALLEEFCAFVTEHCKNTISKDVWMMVFDLATTVKADLSDYDMDGGAWPVLLDEFVEHYRDQQGKAAA